MKPKASVLFLCAFADTACAPAQEPAVRFAVDDERRLVVLDEAGDETRRLGQLAHAVEQACAYADGGLQQVFVTDGDGHIHHYVTDLERLLYQRSLAVNPDTEACAIGSDGAYVYYLDPATGIWRSSTSAESDAVAEPVELFAPRGRLTPDTAVIDARSLQSAPTPAAATLHMVTAAVETDPVRMEGDAADDPALLVNPIDPGKSLVLGTDKAEGGLRVYGLDGGELQFLPVGRLNNVDVAVIGSGASAFAVAAASNRTHRRVDVFRIDLGTGRVEVLGSWPLDLADSYGLCMRKSGGLEVFVGDTEGLVQRWSLAVDGSGVAAELLDEIRFGSQTEGCHVDDATGVVYIGEEDVGVWSVPLAEPDRRRLILAPTADGLVPDVEGIALFEGADGERWLLVSSQGDDTILVLDAATATVVLKLRIGMNFLAGIDGVSETDGLDVTAATLPGFPQGVLVVQDGRNVAPPAPQNFKLVDWRDVQAFLAGR